MKSPLRVLHVISRLDDARGGPIVALKNFALAQQRRGLQTTIAVAWKQGEDVAAADTLRRQGIDVMPIGPCVGRLMWHPAARRTIRAAVARCDIVHAHGIWEDIHHQAAAASRKLGRPYIVRPCGMLDPWSLSRNYWLKQLALTARIKRDLNQAAALHFTSDLERAAAEALHLQARSLIEGNGIDAALFRNLPLRGAFAARLPFAGEPFILFLGRITPKKGLDLLVRALARPECADVRLAVAGPDEQPYRRTLDALIREIGVSERIFFAGMLRDRAIVEALVDAELTVLPSRQENFATSVLESLAAGTPVIVSDQVDIHPEIARERVGEVVPLAVDPLAAAIAGWMRDPVGRGAARERARAYGLARDWDGVAARWHAHYVRLIEGHRGSRREHTGGARAADALSAQ